MGRALNCSGAYAKALNYLMPPEKFGRFLALHHINNNPFDPDFVCPGVGKTQGDCEFVKGSIQSRGGITLIDLQTENDDVQ
eukprot:Awhi_evm1s9499